MCARNWQLLVRAQQIFSLYTYLSPCVWDAMFTSIQRMCPLPLSVTCYVMENSEHFYGLLQLCTHCKVEQSWVDVLLCMCSFLSVSHQATASWWVHVWVHWKRALKCHTVTLATENSVRLQVCNKIWKLDQLFAIKFSPQRSDVMWYDMIWYDIWYICVLNSPGMFLYMQMETRGQWKHF